MQSKLEQPVALLSKSPYLLQNFDDMKRMCFKDMMENTDPNHAFIFKDQPAEVQERARTCMALSSTSLNAVFMTYTDTNLREVKYKIGECPVLNAFVRNRVEDTDMMDCFPIFSNKIHLDYEYYTPV